MLKKIKGGLTTKITNLFVRFIPFWIFLIVYKLGGSFHYSVISPLGERLFPIWLVGILMGGGSLIQLLLDVPAGKLLDRFGYLRLLKLTTFIFLLAGGVMLFNFNIYVYLASLILATFGWLFFAPGVGAYILANAPKSDSGKFISFRDASESIGVVIASAILGIFLAFDTKAIGFLIFGTMAISLIALYFSPRDKISAALEDNEKPTRRYSRQHSLKDIIKVIKKLNPASFMLLCQGLSSSIFYGIVWFVVPLVIAHQADSGLLSLGLGVFDLAIVVCGFMLGSLADKINKRILVFFGLLIFSISGALSGLNFNWLFLIFGFFATVGDEMSGISLWAWLHSLDKDHANDGLVTGIITLFQDLGWTIGPMIAGVIYMLVGPSWTIILGALPIFITWIAYQFSIKIRGHHHHFLGIDIPARPHHRRHKS